MINEIFKLNGATFVAIDWSNVYGWSEDLGWEVDPFRLFDFLSNYQKIYQKNFYFGKDEDNEKTKGLHEEIKKVGYTLITKEVKWIPVYLEKSHFKKVVRKLFDTLDKLKISNSEISNKLYEINKKVEHLPKISIGTKGVAFNLSNEKQLREIYDLIDEVKVGLEGLLEMETIRTDLGKIEVLAIFRTEAASMIVGGKVKEGKIIFNPKVGQTKIKVWRKGEEAGEGFLSGLQSAKSEVKEVADGQECGVKFKGSSGERSGRLSNIFCCQVAHQSDITSALNSPDLTFSRS